MKKSIILFLAAGIIASCSNNNTSSSGSGKDSASSGTAASAGQDSDNMSPEAQKGLQLVANNDCLGCHKISETSTGPAYEAVAQRYNATPEVIDTLSTKIIKGGSGKWGTAMMTPHPNLSKEDASLMVKYVLSLKK